MKIYAILYHLEPHTEREMDPVLSELKKIADQQTEINKKLDLAVTKDDLKKSLTEIKHDMLSVLQEKLDKLEVKTFTNST